MQFTHATDNDSDTDDPTPLSRWTVQRTHASCDGPDPVLAQLRAEREST